VIGWINPLSGSAATFGELSRDAIEIALEEINADGGVLGAPLRVEYQDNEFRTDQSVTAAEQLADNGVRIIITAGSAVVFALDPVAERRDLLLANVGAQSPQLVETTSTYSFIPMASAEVTRLAELATERLGVESVAIVNVDNDYGEDSADAFEAAFADVGGEIVAREIHDVGATDMRTQLIKIREAQPDAVLIASNVTEVGHVVRQARELGVEAELLGITFALSPDNFEIAGDAINGMHGVAVTFREDTNEQSMAFAEAYEEVAGTAPTIYAATSYDAMHILADAIEEVGSDAPTAVAEYLMALEDYEGVLGPTTFTEDRAVDIPIFEWEIVDGEIEPWEA
jgi:branched-chain amino acid transport system substrate-binding protein